MKFDDPELLANLDQAWDEENGFLGKLRGRQFDEDLGNGYLALLGKVEIPEGSALDPEFVRLVWFVPLFLEWQIDGAVEEGADRMILENLSNFIREKLMELLGVP